MEQLDSEIVAIIDSENLHLKKSLKYLFSIKAYGQKIL